MTNLLPTLAPGMEHVIIIKSRSSNPLNNNSGGSIIFWLVLMIAIFMVLFGRRSDEKGFEQKPVRTEGVHLSTSAR